MLLLLLKYCCHRTVQKSTLYIVHFIKREKIFNATSSGESFTAFIPFIGKMSLLSFFFLFALVVSSFFASAEHRHHCRHRQTLTETPVQRNAVIVHFSFAFFFFGDLNFMQFNQVFYIKSQ